MNSGRRHFCILIVYNTSLLSSHSKLCQWIWATAAFEAVETAGLVSMAAPQPLTLVVQAPPRDLLLSFHTPRLGPASRLQWIHLAPPWWLSHKHNPSPVDIICTQLVSRRQHQNQNYQNFMQLMKVICLHLVKSLRLMHSWKPDTTRIWKKHMLNIQGGGEAVPGGRSWLLLSIFPYGESSDAITSLSICCKPRCLCSSFCLSFLFISLQHRKITKKSEPKIKTKQ